MRIFKSIQSWPPKLHQADPYSSLVRFFIETEMEVKYQFDPNVECDAPTYVDFTDLASQYDDNADEWFGKLFQTKVLWTFYTLWTLLYILDRRALEEDPAFKPSCPPEEVKGGIGESSHGVMEGSSPELQVEKSSPKQVKGRTSKGGTLQTAANTLAEMIASGTGTISNLKSRYCN